MWELDCEEGWAPKNWCFWTVVLEKTPVSPLDCKEIQPVHSEGDQLWVFFGGNNAKAETPVLWPPHAKSWLIGKDSDAGRDWGQEEKGTTEGEMAGWHHWLNGHESGWTRVVGDGQGGLACCNSWGRKESDTTEWLIWSDDLISAPFLFLEKKLTYFWLHQVLVAGTWILLLRQMGLVVTEYGLSCPVACGILVPGTGIEPTSPALETGLLTIWPPRKSPLQPFLISVTDQNLIENLSGHVKKCVCFSTSIW